MSVTRFKDNHFAAANELISTWLGKGLNQIRFLRQACRGARCDGNGTKTAVYSAAKRFAAEPEARQIIALRALYEAEINAFQQLLNLYERRDGEQKEILAEQQRIINDQLELLADAERRTRRFDLLARRMKARAVRVELGNKLIFRAVSTHQHWQKNYCNN